MKKKSWILAAVIFVVLTIIACMQAVKGNEKEIDQLYTVSSAGNGNALLTWYEDGKNVVALIDSEGHIIKSVSDSRKDGNIIYQFQAACAGNDGRVYVLRNACDEISGEWLSEDLIVYDFNAKFPSKSVVDVNYLQAKEEDGTEPENWAYKWMSVSGDVVSVIGVNRSETEAVRRVFEFGSVTETSLNIKSERYYPLAEDEGVYQAVGNGTDIAYISKSGKVFHASQEIVEEIYPARDVDTLMYPLYIAFAESGYVYIQDGESGSILKLNIQDGSEELVMKGEEGFSVAGVTPKDICMISMYSPKNFTAVISESAGDGYELVIMEDGIGHRISTLRWSAFMTVMQAIAYLFAGIVVTAAAVGLIWLIYRGILHGRTMMGKLMIAALPLMILTMSVFGIVAYQYYHESLIVTFEKQTVDEGNVMTALFGQESFEAIEYPYDYVSDDYSYLKDQMDGRKLYSRVVYFEDGNVYIGVDKNMPCFYPIGISANKSLENLYIRAALSGEAVTATVEDRAGERILSVTPVGGSAGRTVYLYETGIFTAEMEAYENSYIRNFVWICAAFLVVLVILLYAMFLKILQPLGEIRTGMELFTEGKRDIRIEPETKDELAGISRVFNKMADDIDLQILNLKTMSDIYYKFMPMNMINLLDEDNLGNLKPGTYVKGNYAVLSVQLRSRMQQDSFEKRARELNRFVNMINAEAQKQNAVSIVDSANLTSILLICQDGAASAIKTALTILAEVDAFNAGIEEDKKLDLVFLLHRTDIYVGICGDEKRYIPALLTPELEEILSDKDKFMELDSRLLITNEAFRELDSQNDFGIRYVGALGMKNCEAGFYECFDDRDAQVTHALKVTNSNFRKAIKLYEEGYLYEAKNLFSMVLQDNPNDRIARYYIFRCG